jgi:hypothetical protein
VLYCLESQAGAIAMGFLRAHGFGQLSERLCHARLPSFLDRLPPRSRDPNADRLDRLAARHHHLALCYREPAPDEAGEHLAAEAMATEEQLLVDAMAAAREQLQRPLLFRACADYRH